MPILRVVYDHQAFTLQQVGGISRYFCELASRVGQSAAFDARIIAPVHGNDYLSSCDVPQLGLHLPMWLPGTDRLYRAACNVLAPVSWLASNPSIIHRTYYARPYAPSGVPTVVTVFDMIHEIFPEEFPAGDNTSRDKRDSVRSADLVLCTSTNTAKDVVRLLGVPHEKIRITHLGVSDTVAGRGIAAERPHPRPYLLYVGHRSGYKNFDAALRAYARSTRLHQELDVVVFGGSRWRPDEEARIASLGLRRNAVHRLTGSDEALANAYRHAHALVFPSQYEGFGLPPLEAMAMGCPVACSNVSAIPEVVGSAAELFDPNDVEAIEGALDRVCFDTARREELIAAGFQRVTQFSWDRCAAETMSAYRALLGSGLSEGR